MVHLPPDSRELISSVAAHFLFIPPRCDGELYHFAAAEDTDPLRSGACGTGKEQSHGRALSTKTQEQHVSTPRKFLTRWNTPMEHFRNLLDSFDVLCAVHFGKEPG